MSFFTIQKRADVVATSISWLALFALILGIVSASLYTPPAAPADAPATDFSAARAMLTLKQITQQPHPVGTQEHERVRQYLFQQMSQLGMEPTVETATGTNLFGTAVAARVSNIVGRLKGTKNTQAIMLVAHYDSVDRAPGAGDDGAGVAAILETVRALKAGPPLKNDVIVLLTDGEELGLLGATAAVTHDAWLQQVGLMLNFEGRGDQGPSFLFESSNGNSRLIQEFARSAPSKTGSSLFYTMYKQMPNDTDFTVFRRSGMAGLNFAWLGRLEAYHTRLDSADNLNPGSLQQDGNYALALTRAFGMQDLDRTQLKTNRDEIYFNLLGTWMVHYSETLARLFLVAITVLLGCTLISGIRSDQFRSLLLLRVTGAALLFVLIVTLITWGAYVAENHFFSERELVGDAPANIWLLVGILLLGFTAGLWVFRLFRKRWDISALLAASCILLWFFTVAMAWKLPLASYLFFWPLACATSGLLLLIWGKCHSPIALRAMAWWCALPALLLSAPFLYLLFEALEFTLPLSVLAGVLLGIGLLSLLPLAETLAPGKLAISALILSSAVAISFGGWLSQPSEKHPMPDTLVYRLDADSGKAQWASLDTAPDPWTEKMLTTSPRQEKTSWYGDKTLPVLVADAPTLALPAPEIKVVSNTQQNNVHTIRLQLISSRHAPWLRLQLESNSILSAEVDGESVQDKSGEAGVAGQAFSQAIQTLNVYGYNNTGVTLELKLKVPSSCAATLSDGEYSLPGMVPPRPSNRMAWYRSDYTIVTRQVSIC